MSIEGAAAQSRNYLQANGIDIYYETYGSGEPLVLLLGDAGNLDLWDQHGPIFAQHVMVIATDRRAHGRTKNLLDTLSKRLLADDKAAFIRGLGLNRPLVCGYSDGGQIALEMAMN